MRNKIQSLQFHSSLAPRAIMCVPLASWPWFLFSLWVIPKLEGQEKAVDVDFLIVFVQLGISGGEKHQTENQAKHTFFDSDWDLTCLWRHLSTILINTRQNFSGCKDNQHAFSNVYFYVIYIYMLSVIKI